MILRTRQWFRWWPPRFRRITVESMLGFRDGIAFEFGYWTIYILGQRTEL